jgi:mRNA interferase HicA
MNTAQLIRKLRRLAHKQGATFQVQKRRGKGSHVTLIFGGRKVICPDGELKPGTLRVDLERLGPSEDDPR